MQLRKPGVGVGIIIENSEGEILIGKRLGTHAPFYSIPGGALELGETFEDAATREIREETNLRIKNPIVIAVANNVQTYKQEGRHTISIILYSNTFSGVLKNREPHKCAAWLWCNPNDVPQPHFEASQYGIECYLSKKFYIK